MKIFTIVLTLVLLTACGQSQANQTQKGQPIASNTPAIQTENSKTSENECKICDFDFPSYKGDLKKEEIDGLLLALNDEFLALATYHQINKDFNDPRPFVNIEQAEAKHAERLKQVFETYKMPVPENKWLGNVPKFQSVEEACKAGVEAEIVNRDLYTKLFETTKREDILIVYRALQKASEESHLPAFERCGGGRRN